MGKIVAVVGMAGSGKGTITDHLEKQGFPKVYLGGMVYEEVEKRGLDIVKHEKEVREDMRAKEGPAVMAIRACKRADELFEQGHETVVFDGLYSWSEYKYISEKYGDDMIVLAVFTPKKVRYQRVVERGDHHRQYTEADIKRRDYEEIENIEKGGPIAMADYTLTNTKTPQDLIKAVDELFEELSLAK